MTGKARRRPADRGSGPRTPVQAASGRRNGAGSALAAARGWGRGTHLGADRRHQRVGNAGRRRQGQGAEGRGRERDRVRRRASPISRRPRAIIEAAVAAAREPRFHHYSPTPGLPELRAAIAHKTKRDSGVDCAAEQVLVTNGGKHAVYNTFQVLCDPGDEVLLPAPYWTSYPECITLGGGVPVVLPTTEATGFRVTIEQLEAAVTPRTKVLLFVSPSNPTGAVYPPDEVEAIGRWALERGIWIVTDEIYEHLTYDGHVFSSMPGPRARARRHSA